MPAEDAVRSGPRLPVSAAGAPYARAMSSTTLRVRLTAPLIAGGLLLAPLAGCNVNSDTVSCSGSSCSVTLSGDGASAEILGNELAFGGVQDGRATLSAGGQSVSCAQGESVSAGPFSLTCTEVTDDSVTLEASLG
jgi:hypothetical protein